MADSHGCCWGTAESAAAAATCSQLNNQTKAAVAARVMGGGCSTHASNCVLSPVEAPCISQPASTARRGGQALALTLTS